MRAGRAGIAIAFAAGATLLASPRAGVLLFGGVDSVFDWNGPDQSLGNCRDPAAVWPKCWGSLCFAGLPPNGLCGDLYCDYLSPAAFTLLSIQRRYCHQHADGFGDVWGRSKALNDKAQATSD